MELDRQDRAPHLDRHGEASTLYTVLDELGMEGWAEGKLVRHTAACGGGESRHAAAGDYARWRLLPEYFAEVSRSGHERHAIALNVLDLMWGHSALARSTVGVGSPHNASTRRTHMILAVIWPLFRA
jgi:hypothetical protein